MRQVLHAKGCQSSIEDIHLGGKVTPNHHWIYGQQKSPTLVISNPLMKLIEEKSNAHIVRIRLVFIRIGKRMLLSSNHLHRMSASAGEIDTLNEKYQADIYFEARWTNRINLDTLGLSPQQYTQLMTETMPVRVNELNPVIHWTPELFIENAIAQIGEFIQQDIFRYRSIQNR
jgi:hypothetical protein